MGVFGFGSTAIRSTVITGKLALARFSVQQTEGLKGCVRYGWLGGFAKVDNRFGYEKWT